MSGVTRITSAKTRGIGGIYTSGEDKRHRDSGAYGQVQRIGTTRAREGGFPFYLKEESKETGGVESQRQKRGDGRHSLLARNREEGDGEEEP